MNDLHYVNLSTFAFLVINRCIVIVITATKLDTRSRVGQALDSAHGSRLCKSLKLHGFQECSSKTGQGVREVFHTAVEVALRGQKKTPTCWQTKCVLL